MSSKRAKSDNERRQFWQMAIETWQDSGISIRAFCKSEGFSEGTFHYWRKKLSCNHSQQNEHPGPSQSPFIEIAVPKSNHAALELVLCSGNMLRISSAADGKTLSNAISVLCKAGLC